MIFIWVKFKCGKKVRYRKGGIGCKKCNCAKPSIALYEESESKPDWY